MIQFRPVLPKGDVMKIVRDQIRLAELKDMAEHGFGTMVKAVVDVEAGIMAVDAELHSDEEALLLENGSAQPDLWGSTSTRMSPARTGSSSTR